LSEIANKPVVAIPSEHALPASPKFRQNAQSADQNILTFDGHEAPDTSDAVDHFFLQSRALLRGHRWGVSVINSVDLDGLQLWESSDLSLDRRAYRDNSPEPTLAGALHCKVTRVFKDADVGHDRQIQNRCC
jgi:hypothetical protein